VDAQGAPTRVATLRLILEEGAVLEWADGSITEHPGVPWFLEDIRPQGFLGRQFSQAHPDLHLPPPNRWTSSHTLRALATRGEDLSGDLILGKESLDRFYARCTPHAVALVAVREEARKTGYRTLIDEVLQGGVPGSSAAGERPKFTCAVAAGPHTRHVIVKFSDSMDAPAGRRWADLLQCEHLALETLRDHGLPAAQSQILFPGDRVCLETARFDRVGSIGRRPLVSLASVDAELIGQGLSWSAAAVNLESQDRLSSEDAARVCTMEAFGRLIFNDDRHQGNLSFFWRAPGVFELAPIYDMLPMAFRPESPGLASRALTPPTPDADVMSVWAKAKEMALDFWARVQREKRISDELKKGPVRRAMEAIARSP
jgi:hypothetical protein